jgi:UDP-N-acetylmuramate dehydrogenase
LCCLLWAHVYINIVNMPQKNTCQNLDSAANILRERFGDKILLDYPLANLTSFGTGGKARIFVEVSTTDELSRIAEFSCELEIPIFMLGGGSNLLVSDSGYNGLIIKNSIMGKEISGTDIVCGAGELLQDIINFSAENNLAGLEFATGIWGTIGGAIYGNAGAYGSEIGTFVMSAQVVSRQGNIKNIESGYLEFGYRTSKLKESGEFVANAKLALKSGTKEVILGRIREIMDLRKTKLPLDEKSAGCFFKNIIDERQKFGKLPAGQLLEEVGAKDTHYGGARVFPKHANIIVNDGTAQSKDIKRLADILKRRVKEKFGILLKEEVTLLGDFEEDRL